MLFTSAKESFGDKESTLWIKGIDRYLQNGYVYVLGEGEHTEVMNYEMEKMQHPTLRGRLFFLSSTPKV